MKTKELIQELLFEERKVPDGKKYIALFDIDDCLLTANNIFIIKNYPDGRVVKLTPDQYAKKNKEQDIVDGVKYSYEEFRDPKKVEQSILSGTPIWKNLKIMNDHVKNGWEVGILTARGLEEVVYNSLKKWLMFREEGELLPKLGKSLARNLVHAISDEVVKYEGITDFEKKAKVIETYAKTYDRVKFIDDDQNNINAVKKLIVKDGYKNIIVVKAWEK